MARRVGLLVSSIFGGTKINGSKSTRTGRVTKRWQQVPGVSGGGSGDSGDIVISRNRPGDGTGKGFGRIKVRSGPITAHGAMARNCLSLSLSLSMSNISTNRALLVAIVGIGIAKLLSRSISNSFG